MELSEWDWQLSDPSYPRPYLVTENKDFKTFITDTIKPVLVGAFIKWPPAFKSQCFVVPNSSQ